MGTPDDDREQDAAPGMLPWAVDNGIEIQATEHIPTVTNQRFLTDVSSVNEFYSLPKKQIKPSCKLPSTPFEAFDMSVYKEKAHFNAFRSSPNDYLVGYWLHIRLRMSIWERMIIILLVGMTKRTIMMNLIILYVSFMMVLYQMNLS